MAFYRAPTVNFFSTTLNGAINNSTGTITLNSVTGLQFPGVLVIDRQDSNNKATPTLREVIAYTGISGNDLTGCTRGFDTSTAGGHSNGALVESTVAVGVWNGLRDAVAASLTTDGSGIALSGTASIATLNLTNLLSIPKIAITSVASIARVEVPSLVAGFASIATVNTNSIIGSDHVIITPGTSKLLKIPVLRQDDTVNTYANGSVILTGWGYIQGDGSINLEEAVTFGVTFSATPVVIVGPTGYVSSAPSVIGNFNSNFANNGNIWNATFKNANTTSFNVNLRSEVGFVFGNTNYFGYSWTAIGII